MYDNKLKQIFRKVSNQFKEKNLSLGVITNIKVFFRSIVLTLK
jgi:hypothetical protein